MDNVKQETFSNFNYEVIKSIDERCVDVKCIYTYKGKIQAHYFSYVKSGNKPSSYYISKAKADMDKLVKSKSPASVAKKDLNGSKATFFKRHKKLIIGLTTAVLVAGVAAAATLVTMKYLTRPADPTAVTEEEIDSYIEGPKGESRQISELLARNVVTSALFNYDTNSLKNVETKWISSNPIKDLLYNTPAPGSNIAVEEEISPYNDTTGFFTDNLFKSKNYYKSYLQGRILSDAKDSKAGTIYMRDNLETFDGNVSATSKLETDVTMKSQLNKDETIPGNYITFVNGKYNYDGYGGDNLRMANIMESGFETPSAAGDAIKQRMVQYSRYLDMFTPFFVQQYIGDYINNFRVSEKDSTVYLKLDLIKEDLVPSQVLKQLNIMGIPITAKLDVVWTFKNIGEDGWVLDTFACEGYNAIKSLLPSNSVEASQQAAATMLPKYVEYNDKGEKLSEPICINKDKMFTKLTYGDLDTDKKIDEISYNGEILNESPLKVMACYSEDEEDTIEPICEAIDYTAYRRVENSKFDGFSLYGTVSPNGKVPQCLEGSGVVFAATDDKKNDDIQIPLGYEELKSYLDANLFEKGWECKNPQTGQPLGIYTIKLKKAGWFNFELTFNNKLELSNLVIDFHEGPSPINPLNK